MKALERYLNSFGKSVVKQSKELLVQDKKVVTGALLNSIKYNIVKTSNGYNVQFSMLDYGKFMDKGVSGVGGTMYKETDKYKPSKKEVTYTGERTFTDFKGIKRKSPYSYVSKMPPTKALDKWTVMRGLAPRDVKGRFLTRSSLKFALSRSIFIKGIEGISFFQKPLGIELRGFSAQIQKAVKEDILNNLRK